MLAGGESVGGESASRRGRRRSRPSGDDRERDILATAERLLAERNVAEIAIDDLARGAGISRPTFYFYFPSKEAVLLALLDRVAEEARQRAEVVLADASATAPEIWRRSVRAIIDTFRNHRALMLAVAQLEGQSEDLRKLWARIIDGFVELTAFAIDCERERGVAPGGPPSRQLAIALNWMNERVFHVAMAGYEPAIPEGEAFDTLLSVWSRAIYGDDSLGG